MSLLGFFLSFQHYAATNMYFLSKKSYMATLKPPALSGDKLDGCAQANLLLPNAFSPLAIRSKFFFFILP